MQKTGLVRGGARFSIYAAVADDTCRHVRCNCMGFDGTTPGVCTVSRHPKTSYRAVVIGALSDDDNDNNACMGFDGTTPGVCTVSRHPKTSYRAVVIGA